MVSRNLSLALGMTPKGLDSISQQLADEAMLSIEQQDRLAEKQGKSKISNDKTRTYTSAYLNSFVSGLSNRIKVLEDDAASCKTKIYNLRKEYETQVAGLRRKESQLQKLEDSAKFRSTFCNFLKGVVKICFDFYIQMNKNIIAIAVDLLSGDLEFSFSEIKKRLLDDTLKAVSTAGVQSLNLTLATAASAAERVGGAQALAVINSISKAVHSAISNACSGPIKDIAKSVAEYSEAAMNPNPAAVFAEGISKKVQKTSNKTDKIYGKAGSMEMGDATKDSLAAIKQELFSEDALKDYAKVAAKTGLSAATSAFPPAKAVAAATSVLSDSYLAFCQATDDLPAILIAEKSGAKSEVVSKGKVAALRKDIDSKADRIEQQSLIILRKINEKDATDVEIIQYNFCVAFLMRSTNQLSFLAKTFPYLSKEELVTVFFSYLGDVEFGKARDLLNANMLSMFLRAFFVFVDEELQHEAQQCPLLPKGLADQMKKRYNLTQENYCKNLSNPEIREMLHAYDLLPKYVPTKATSIESLVAENKSLFQMAEKDFAAKYLPAGTKLSTRALIRVKKQDPKKQSIQKGTTENLETNEQKTKSSLWRNVAIGIGVTSLGVIGYYGYTKYYRKRGMKNGL
jgi:hypothetical protein